MSPLRSVSGTSPHRTRMLLEVVAKADTLLGPLEGTAARGWSSANLQHNGMILQVWHISILTGLPGPAVDRLAPGPRADTVNGLNPDLILSPLLQVLDSELPLQSVHDHMGENSSRRTGFRVLHPVADEIGIPIVLPLWKRLRGFFFLLILSVQANSNNILTS